MVDKKTMGLRLKKLRGDKAVQEVAFDLGICPSALSNYENGIRTPRDQIKFRIAQYYNVSLESIFFNS